MHPLVKDLTGYKNGKLTVIGFCETRNGHAYWNVQCQCGSVTAVQRANIMRSTRKSCGCEGGVQIHGLWKHPLYLTWQNMMTRCYNPNSADWKDYGGRGITVCERWHKVENFVEDMVERPDGCQIDRKNNELGYSKENCQWSTKLQNARNRRNNKIVVYQGKEMSMAEAAELSGVPYLVLSQRVRLGKNPDIFRK